MYKLFFWTIHHFLFSSQFVTFRHKSIPYHVDITLWIYRENDSRVNLNGVHWSDGFVVTETKVPLWQIIFPVSVASSIVHCRIKYNIIHSHKNLCLQSTYIFHEVILQKMPTLKRKKTNVWLISLVWIPKPPLYVEPIW